MEILKTWKIKEAGNKKKKMYLVHSTVLLSSEYPDDETKGGN